MSPIQTLVTPYQLRFLPAMSSRIAVLSSLGQVQLVDMAALSAPQISCFQVNMPMEGCSTISMDISPSNQCLAFGDTTNSVHLYSSVPEPVLNPFARDTEFADEATQYPYMDINDPLAIYSSIPRPHLPSGQTHYASDFWPERFAKPAYRPTPEIDPEILQTMKIVGTVGYARNVSNSKRNQVRYARQRGSIDKEGQGQKDSEIAENLGVPKQYRKVAIKLSKMGTDDFDFDRYNRTGFCGLEASLPNSYCNSMLQILYYTERLRILILNHTCNRENCVCCELSFLFHMMDISRGIPCHSGNLLRSLRTIPEASALGLIFTDQNSVWKANVPRLIQSWNRFILQQIFVQSSSGLNGGSLPKWAKETAPPTPDPSADGSGSSADPPEDPLFSQLFGIKQEKVNVCSKCKKKVSTKDTVLLCNLLYPDQGAAKPEPTSFQQVVCSSMCPEQTTPAWCEKCKKYQSTNQSRNLLSLPQILSFNAGMDNAQDLAFWEAQMEYLYEANKPAAASFAKAAAAAVPEAGGNSLPPANAKPCRYGLTCNRPDCKFWHPEAGNESPTKEDNNIGEKLAAINQSWVPMEVKINRHVNGKVSHGDVDSLDGAAVEESKTYQL